MDADTDRLDEQDRVILTLFNSQVAGNTQTFAAIIYDVGPYGIVWRSSHVSHPDSRQFIPWSRVKCIDW